MTLDKTHLIVFIVGAILGLVAGFFTGKGIYDRPIEESVTRDTLRTTDTIHHYYPQPKERQVVRYVTRLLPMTKVVGNTDTLTLWAHDTVAVEVPITSKHYGSKDYDAWVSGYEPSLDSIKVYKETQYITETITRTIKDKGKHFFLDVGAGCEYRFNGKAAVPFAELGARVKLGRFGIGAYGGYSHDTKENKGLPYAKAKVTYEIVSF